MSYSFLAFIILTPVLLIASFIATYLVAFFGPHRDIRSVAIASGILLLSQLSIVILGIGGPLSFGVIGFTGIIVFVKFLHFEPMGALFAGILFSIFFNGILASGLSLVGGLEDEQRSRTIYINEERGEEFNEYLKSEGVDPEDNKAVWEHIQKMNENQQN